MNFRRHNAGSSDLSKDSPGVDGCQIDDVEEWLLPEAVTYSLLFLSHLSAHRVQRVNTALIMAALYVTGGIIFLPCNFFLSIFLFFLA